MEIKILLGIYLFSSEYDFSHFLDFNNQNFHKLFFNNEKVGICLQNIQAIKGKPFEDKYLAFLLVTSGIQNNFSLLLPSDIKKYDYMFNIRFFNYIYVIQLIVYWNYPFDYNKLAKHIYLLSSHFENNLIIKFFYSD